VDILFEPMNKKNKPIIQVGDTFPNKHAEGGQVEVIGYAGNQDVTIKFPDGRDGFGTAIALRRGTIKPSTHKHLSMIDNLDFMQWCDSLNKNERFNPAELRRAFILIHKNKLTSKRAGQILQIKSGSVSARIQGYLKLVEEYLNKPEGVK